MAIEHKKVTVTLPQSLLERLNKRVPSRKRSLFITEAITEQLEQLEQLSALDETAGAWTLENHPTMQTDEGIDKWLKESRQDWG